MPPSRHSVERRVSDATQAFTHALYSLTTYPEHFLPMREEAERIVRQDGWTKNALNNMHKIDSFLRETQRINVISPGARHHARQCRI